LEYDSCVVSVFQDTVCSYSLPYYYEIVSYLLVRPRLDNQIPKSIAWVNQA